MKNKALSVRQPWAHLILNGRKPIETRSWQTEYRGDLVICSGIKIAPGFELDKSRMNEHGMWTFDPETGEGDYMLYGYALCLVELYHIEPMKIEHEKAAMCDAIPGLFAWHLRHVRPLNPTKIVGELRLFEVSL